MAEHQQFIPLSSAASTADGTWCTVRSSGADPDDCCKAPCCILYLFYVFFCLLSSFFSVASRRYSSYVLSVTA